MLSPRLLRVTVGLVLVFVVAASAADKPPRAVGGGNVAELHAEITALQVLHHLKATPAQLKELATLAATTVPRPGPRKVIKVSDEYRKTLLALRTALVDGKSEEIVKLSNTLEDLREKEEPDLDDADITAEARKAAPGLLRQFSARQLVAYLGNSGDDFPDPTEQLMKGIEQSRELKGKDWREMRDNLAYQVGWLVGGIDEDAETKARDAATALLNKSAGLDAKQFKEQRAALEKEASDIVGKVTATEAIRHFLERTLAELLSNPRLLAALEARARRPVLAEKGVEKGVEKPAAKDE
jgi:hypothetical protein